MLILANQIYLINRTEQINKLTLKSVLMIPGDILAVGAGAFLSTELAFLETLTVVFETT